MLFEQPECYHVFVSIVQFVLCGGGKKERKKGEKGNQPFQGKLSVAYKVELLSGVRGGGGGATLNVVTTRMTVP